ncbi:distribution and morphology protein Mdm35 [Schizosaccharomyces cryophilus OY26]|uniref:Distribution and morphology protein Mdm35 n=1 Tax=Schizosaccharomyces cryophilus (strain OY26 / ATCC MYA-4695 / CBS 11777 / NBRC 106824 / NRRL Y48691) TaxID=653667 RepID=S9VNE1_SCHCR|nr:distribution and morphology protein Mdm35 [Schizosaccharomyces cryophilus OY26]EPY49463.1 distribution and morphology protein Mdm35 [Schizosaccharomyces cryophilus OY26]
MSSSFSEECTPAKQKYDTCFNDWYVNKFLKGDIRNRDCDDLFLEYKQCLMKAIKTKKIEPLLEAARKEE